MRHPFYLRNAIRKKKKSQMDFQVVVFFKPGSKGKTNCILVMYKDNYTRIHTNAQDTR